MIILTFIIIAIMGQIFDPPGKVDSDALAKACRRDRARAATFDPRK
jgi:hypothetical protein